MMSTIEQIEFVFHRDDSCVNYVRTTLEDIEKEFVGCHISSKVLWEIKNRIDIMLQDIVNKYNFITINDNVKIDWDYGSHRVNVDLSECVTNIYVWQMLRDQDKEIKRLRKEISELQDKIDYHEEMYFNDV